MSAAQKELAERVRHVLKHVNCDANKYTQLLT